MNDEWTFLPWWLLFSYFASYFVFTYRHRRVGRRCKLPRWFVCADPLRVGLRRSWPMSCVYPSPSVDSLFVCVFFTCFSFLLHRDENWLFFQNKHLKLIPFHVVCKSFSVACLSSLKQCVIQCRALVSLSLASLYFNQVGRRVDLFLLSTRTHWQL